MKIAVIGLWHLGLVTAACLATKTNHEVIAYDPSEEIIAQLKKNHTPLSEPGLDHLLEHAKTAGKLRYSNQPADLLDADIVWMTFDTPVDENDRADVDFVTRETINIFPYLQNNALLLISSQVPVGTTRQLQTNCPSHQKITFAYLPENLRLGKAIEVFTQPDRFIVGLNNKNDENIKNKIRSLLTSFTENIIWMSLESAEMTKHALNAFLATSVVFINELATLCEHVGADAREVESGLKSEERIGQKAYLRPGNTIAGGTLARDVNFLVQIGQQKKINTPLFSTLLTSNQAHKHWSCRRMTDVLNDLNHKTIATLGLTYKAGTNTLRRSSAVETCRWLSTQGATIVAYDPAITHLPSDLMQFISLKSTLNEALCNADAIVIATDWPEFTALSADQLLATVKQPYVFDAGGFLANTLGNDARVRYFSVGRPL